MFTLIALLTSTSLGEFRTQTQCNNAIKQIYVQQLDPYHTLPKNVLNEVIGFNMKYDAPKKYICIKH